MNEKWVVIEEEIEKRFEDQYQFARNLLELSEKPNEKVQIETDDEVIRKNHDQLVQTLLEKEILEAQNRAHVQQITHLQLELRQNEKLIRSLKDQLLTVKLENQSLKDSLHDPSMKNAPTKDNVSSTMILTQQSELLQNYINDLEQIFYSENQANTLHNSLVLESDYQKKLTLIKELQQENNNIKEKLQLYEQKEKTWREEKVCLVENLEASTITEQALYTANLRKDTALKTSEDRIHQLLESVSKEQEQMAALSSLLSQSESNYQTMEKELKHAVVEVKEHIQR